MSENEPHTYRPMTQEEAKNLVARAAVISLPGQFLATLVIAGTLIAIAGWWAFR